MKTLLITDNSPEAIQFFEHALTLPFIREKSAKKEAFGRIPGLPYTGEERIASVRKAVEEYEKTGEAYSTEEMEEYVSRLK